MSNELEKIEENIESNKKPKNKEKRKKIFKRTMITIGILTIIGIITVGSGVSYIYIKNKDNISKCISNGYAKVEKIDENTFNSRHESQLLDKDGVLLKEFKIANYDYEKYNEIDKRVFDAFVAIEDERFYKHTGIDYKSLVKVGIDAVLKPDKQIRGASTITQQLVKNVFLTQDRTAWRKIEEMVIAQELEKKYSKEEILEFYVNNIYFGYGCYGIETASDYFFQKPTEELTLSEIAFLVAIPNNPSLFDPVTKYENTTNRKENILYKMFELEMISEEELNKCLEEEIKLNKKEVSFDNSVNGYDKEYAMQKATESFMKSKGFQFRYNFNNNEERNLYFEQYEDAFSKCREELITGGYVIETSIDSEKQNEIQRIVDNELSGYTQLQDNGLYIRQASATVLDNETGEVVAIVGGRSQDGNNFNRASLGARQPGSTLKPLISYTPAFEKGYFPDSIMEDKKIDKGPANWYSGYKGNVTLRYATEISLNTIPYRLSNEVGMDVVLGKLQSMNFKYLTPEDKSPIIAVGGMTRGTTVTEVASGYSTLARNGEFIEPTNVKKITKVGTEDVIFENVHSKRRIYDAGASYLMTDVLKGVLTKPHGTGYGYKMNNWENQVAKTGTTDNNKDLWTVGYTPYYTTAVWIGNDMPSEIYNGFSAPKNIWKNTMNYLHKGLEDKPFVKPENIYKENGYLKCKVSKENEIISQRKKLEEERKSKEISEQNRRLQEEEYRIKYGLSDEEEYAREVRAENSIKTLENYPYNSLKNENELKELIRIAKACVDDVKKKSAYDIYTNRLNNIVSKLEAKNNQMKEDLRLKEEEERRKEEEERKKQEEEKRKQEEEEKRKEEEEFNKPKPEPEKPPVIPPTDDQNPE